MTEDVELAWAAVSCPRCNNPAVLAPRTCPADDDHQCHCCPDCAALCARVASARGSP